jgi:predicted membrane-bound mannosyltransferase
MLADLSFIIACVALISSTMLIWIYKTVLDENQKAMKKIWSRIQYIEVAMSYHDMIPLPWEIDDLNKQYTEIEKTRELKRDGNIVYLDKN